MDTGIIKHFVYKYCLKGRMVKAGMVCWKNKDTICSLSNESNAHQWDKYTSIIKGWFDYNP